MAAAGIAGLLRSLASKLAPHAPPPHHRLAASGIHPGFSRCSSRPFSSSRAGATANKATQKNKTVVSDPDSANKAMIMTACFMMVGGCVYIYGWVIPTMNRIQDKLIADSRARSKREHEFNQGVQHECDKICILHRQHNEFIKGLLVLTNNPRAQTGRTSGNGKERGGLGDV